MAHDLHFLERLERVTIGETELALTLYRDPEFVRIFLADARLPEGAERVAIALSESSPTPHLLVDRGSGAFVTCLSAEMRVGDDIPVLRRAQLDGAIIRIERLRAARDLAADLPMVRRHWQHLFSAAEALSREEMQVHLDLAPLMACAQLEAWAATAREVDALRLALRRKVGLTPRPADLAQLETFWQRSWALAHLTVLVSSGAQVAFEESTNVQAFRQATLLLNVLGLWPLIARGIWGAARLGKAVLPAYKEGLVFARNSERLLDATLSLGAIGLRHARLRAEVEKALTLSASGGAAPDGLSVLVEFAENVRRVVANPEPHFDLHRTHAAAEFSSARARRDGVRLLRPLTAAETPEALALTLSIQSSELPKLTAAGALNAAVQLPWLARTGAEALYLPSADLPLLERRFTPELATLLLPTATQLEQQRPEPVRNPVAKIGRNAPCACGSGKKSKHCCGG